MATEVRPTEKAQRPARSISSSRKQDDIFTRNLWQIPPISAAFAAGYVAFPNPSNPLRSLFLLSYQLPSAQDADPSAAAAYGKGPSDILFVAAYTILFCFFRQFVMSRLLRPLSVRVGIKGDGKQERFCEQIYSATYAITMGILGLAIMKGTPMWYFNTAAFYEEYPHRTLDGGLKAYYLIQAAFWVHQMLVLVLGLEKPRKDFHELIAHHIITVSLIGLSYHFHFTHIGLAVFISNDIPEFFLATSKALHYVDFPLIAPYFAIFISAWIYMRHYLSLRIIWSLFTEFRTVGPYGMDWDNEQYKGELANGIAIVLLGTLQLLNLYWLRLLLNIAKGFLLDGEARDDRSDDEDDEVEEEEEKESTADALDEVLS
ncbi:sphingosine N-acyltransferase LAC1 (TLC domain-containing protein) [Phlyctema vagabunda]|uniref:Sphingosine N-acyltransferase LAC1 (TLC domain-containing protein) n=1 Tax=Phlyctema vagabunda TaxID=108571 RepID=A0ABR4PWV4_9HELO